MKTGIRAALTPLWAVLAVGMTPNGTLAHDAHRHGGEPKGPAVAAPAAPKERVPLRLDETEQRRYFTDTRLTDQDGRKVRFPGDAIGDLQDQLGDRLDREVRLISISVDPATDIPPRLKKYAEQWEARPGWLFLTGEKKAVDRVLEGIGMYSPDFTDHPSAFLVGDGKTGEWTRFCGFATPEQLKSRVEELLAERRARSPAPVKR